MQLGHSDPVTSNVSSALFNQPGYSSRQTTPSCIRCATTMRSTNLHFAYLLTYLQYNYTSSHAPGCITAKTPWETTLYLDQSARARYWHLSRPALEHRGRQLLCTHIAIFLCGVRWRHNRPPNSEPQVFVTFVEL